MEMTIFDLKIEMMKKGYTLIERDVNGNIEMIVTKFDKDGLVFEARQYFTYGVYEDYNYYENLKNLVDNTDKVIKERHKQNINSCNHFPIMIGDKKGCTKCMINFGNRIMLDINLN